MAGGNTLLRVGMGLATMGMSEAGYQAVQGSRDLKDSVVDAPKRRAQEAMDASTAAAQNLLNQQQAFQQQAEDVSTANLMRDAAKRRQQQIIGGQMGRGSTILTGGLGVTSPAQTANHPLLGQ